MNLLKKYRPINKQIKSYSCEDLVSDLSIEIYNKKSFFCLTDFLLIPGFVLPNKNIFLFNYNS